MICANFEILDFSPNAQLNFNQSPEIYKHQLSKFQGVDFKTKIFFGYLYHETIIETVCIIAHAYKIT